MKCSVRAAPDEGRKIVDDDLRLRPFSRLRPRIIAVGASTGGPQALGALMARLSPHLGDVPVLIVLHMPADFTTLVTAHLQRVAQRPCLVARDGQAPAPGHLYLAPGRTHLVAEQDGAGIRLQHRHGQGEHHRRTPIDTLFSTVSACWGAAALGIVLTGMGSDGLTGARALVANGGSVIAQDRHSSAVWGMPGAVAREGLASAVLPIEAMAERVATMLSRPGGSRA